MQSVNNCSSVGIIHRKEAPGEVLIEVKTPGYPVPAYVGKGLLPGGNWIGLNAKSDGWPFGTYWREIREEFSFGNPAVDTMEMDALFGAGHLGSPPKPRNIEASEWVKMALAETVQAIAFYARPFGAFVQKVQRPIFDMGNPNNTRNGYAGLCHVFSVPLPEEHWATLVKLQEQYGNLSNEAQTVFTSVREIVEKSMQIGWGQDVILKQFFYMQGLQKEASGMALMPHTTVEERPFCSSYRQCMGWYSIEKIPEGVVRPA